MTITWTTYITSLVLAAFVAGVVGVTAGRVLEAGYAGKRCIDKCECPQGEIAP